MFNDHGVCDVVVYFVEDGVFFCLTHLFEHGVFHVKDVMGVNAITDVVVGLVVPSLAAVMAPRVFEPL